MTIWLWGVSFKWWFEIARLEKCPSIASVGVHPYGFCLSFLWSGRNSKEEGKRGRGMGRMGGGKGEGEDGRRGGGEGGQ